MHADDRHQTVTKDIQAMKSSAMLTRRRPRAAALPQLRSKRRFATQRNRAPGNGSPTPERLMQFAWGFAPPLILEAALNSRVFDLLDQGPQTVGELSAQSGASVRGLTAVLNALVGLEVLARKGSRYALTPESAAFLVSTKPAYHGGFFRHMSRQILPNWLQLAEVVRTCRPVVAGNQQADGEQFFAEFVEGLFPMSYRAAQVMGEHLGIPKAASPVSVLDIGAGSGVWGIALAHQSPHVTIRAVDWPAVLKVTRRVAERHGVGLVVGAGLSPRGNIPGRLLRGPFPPPPAVSPPSPRFLRPVRGGVLGRLSLAPWGSGIAIRWTGTPPGQPGRNKRGTSNRQ